MQKQYYDNFPSQTLFYSKSLKTLRNSVCFQLQFLTNEKTSVHDSGVYFIEHASEFYFQ